MQVESLTLPLPHDWFAAETTLPKHRFRMSQLMASGNAMTGLAARVTQAVANEEFAPSESTLDGAQRLFDSYFLVERASGAPVEMLRAAMAKALPLCAADIETGSALSDVQLQTLARGLHRLADWALIPTAAPAAASPHVTADPLFRWKQQHQLFFLIIHGMLYLLHVLEETLDREHAPVTQAVLSDFADLMEASTVAFHLAADFSPEDYESRIRPDMTAHDPHFSGLFYADHKELVTSLRVLKRVPDDFEEELDRISRAISETYDAHARVCLRFVGETASLASKDDSRIAAESIRGKYVKRTKVIAGLAKPRA
ncbi:hypothetical protein SAMN05421688_0045 [Poseidonocella pacifica]|uniref:Uncharacterized protein n=1 Tax=Poseidonocella pacifica TaxID=871651 RepID=A0A1I0UXR7_9RHOB|nr:hypothetical protein [Poseidonocella pacifica]SFA68838.1 hypothetical protein SAMN05421688_0045 [Poseidonocella pacifica]